MSRSSRGPTTAVAGFANACILYVDMTRDAAVVVRVSALRILRPPFRCDPRSIPWGTDEDGVSPGTQHLEDAT
jgi:hypothetical protein